MVSPPELHEPARCALYDRCEPFFELNFLLPLPFSRVFRFPATLWSPPFFYRIFEMNSNPNSSSSCSPTSARADRNIRTFFPAFQGYPSPLLAAFFPEFAEGLGFTRAVRTSPASIAATQGQASVASASETTTAAVEPTLRIPVNIADLSDRFEVQASLPGFNFEQVEVTFEDNVLTLKANPSTSAQSDNPKLLRQEILLGSYARSIAFREAINPEAVSATMQAGLLTVTLGKQATAQPRRIAIKNPNSN